ncbi:MAG: TonB-dependent receptor [Polaribacter sp.]|uniref:TonB-dependent receptor n=1 Tax=Polaribacter sp. TaxID=1920175 RepID=UPI003263941B
MKKITIFLFLFASIIANAQTFTLKGKVVDENKESLPGATILVKETEQGTSTDFDGLFNVTLAKGNYTIQVSFIGYKTVSKEISLTKNNEIEFSLVPNSTILEEVLVSATRASSKTPITFTNVTKKELESRNLGQDLPILLDQLTSVVTTSDAGSGVGYTGLRVRGSDASRINVTLNGIPYNDAESQGTYWVNMPDFSSSVEDIQLQRGVGTSTNGAGAFGASLNIKTLEPTEKAYATTSHTFGSYNTRKHNVSVSSGLINNFYATARLSKIASDGYIDRSSADLNSYFLEAGYITDKTKLKVMVFGGHEITQQAWYGTPEAVINGDEDGIQLFLAHEGYSFSDDQIANLENNPDRTYNHYTYDNEVDNYNQKHYQLHLDEKLNDFYTLNISGNYTKGEGYFEQFKPHEEAGDYFPNSLDADDEGEVIRRRWLSNDFYALVSSLNYKKEKLNLTLGGGANVYKGDHFGEVIWDSFPTAQIAYEEEYYFSDAQKTAFNTYLKAEYKINEHFYAFGDVQYRFINHESNGIDSDLNPVNFNEKFNFFNPKVGLTYTFNKESSAYASFAVANKEPSRSDLSRITANAVKPENLQDVEVGYKFRNPKLTLSANVYYMNYKDQLVATGAVDDVGSSIRENVSESYRAGIELQVGYKISDKFRLDANATFSQNKIKNFNYIIFDTQYDDATWNWVSTEAVVTEFKDVDIAFSPSIIANGILTYSPVKNLDLKWISKYVGDQYLDNTGNTSKQIDAYFVNNFNASYSIKPSWIKEVSFNLLVNNILSEAYESNGYTYSYYYRPAGSSDPAITENFYYAQATRNFLLGVTLKF